MYILINYKRSDNRINIITVLYYFNTAILSFDILGYKYIIYSWFMRL